jgi:hypothetical protein
MSLLRLPFRMILRVDVRIGNTGGGTGVIRAGVPRSFQYLHHTESLQRNTSPVGRRTVRLQTTFAFSAVLITQNPQLSLLVPPQSMRTQQPLSTVIHSSYWMPAFHRRPNQTVDVF